MTELFAPLRDLDAVSQVALITWFLWYMVVVIAIVQPPAPANLFTRIRHRAAREWQAERSKPRV